MFSVRHRFDVSAGDPNSGTHDYLARTLLNEPSFQLPIIFVLNSL